MIDFPHLIEPGVRATTKEVVDNVKQLLFATQDIQPHWITESAIQFRHLTAPAWRSITFFSDDASLTQANIASSAYIVPRGTPDVTATHVGGPVIVVASFTATATGSGTNCALQAAIYVDNVKKVEADIRIGEPGIVPVRLFYMFIATSSSHEISIRSDNADTTPANVTVSHRSLHVTAVKVPL